ncbi:MAG: hypothetical protein CM1200mP36_00190 [Gammaproteobacteria bacterium]|nr:MAG: hypothetical protein CM1200mP36_00190 [Gammaproteobacteria bacterium]
MTRLCMVAGTKIRGTRIEFSAQQENKLICCNAVLRALPFPAIPAAILQGPGLDNRTR